VASIHNWPTRRGLDPNRHTTHVGRKERGYDLGGYMVLYREVGQSPLISVCYYIYLCFSQLNYYRCPRCLIKNLFAISPVFRRWRNILFLVFFQHTRRGPDPNRPLCILLFQMYNFCSMGYQQLLN